MQCCVDHEDRPYDPTLCLLSRTSHKARDSPTVHNPCLPVKPPFLNVLTLRLHASLIHMKARSCSLTPGRCLKSELPEDHAQSLISVCRTASSRTFSQLGRPRSSSGCACSRPHRRALGGEPRSDRRRVANVREEARCGSLTPIVYSLGEHALEPLAVVNRISGERFQASFHANKPDPCP
jgi:hypothetical protein